MMEHKSMQNYYILLNKTNKNEKKITRSPVTSDYGQRRIAIAEAASRGSRGASAWVQWQQSCRFKGRIGARFNEAMPRFKAPKARFKAAR